MQEIIHTFAGNPLDRSEATRRDEQAIVDLQQQDNAQFLPFHKLQVGITEQHSLRWLNKTESEDEVADKTNAVFLGTTTQGKIVTPHFALDVSEQEITDADKQAQYVDCRAAVANLDASAAGIVAQARAQLDWHRRNPFCARCGGTNHSERGGQIRRCNKCKRHIFPRTDPVAIMLIVDEPQGERCLLGKSQGRFANSNFYSALAGFIDQGESIEEAVRREVREEAGLPVGTVNYHSSQPWPFPSQLMIGCHGIALSKDIQFDEVEMADVQWFKRDEVLAALVGKNEALSVPGKMAIAHHLINSWATGEIVL